MASSKNRRRAWATGLSLVLHALALTGMVVGLKVAQPPPEGRAVELRLVPAPVLQPRPKPAHKTAERANASKPVQRRLAPQPQAEAPVAALPETPSPAPKPGVGPEADGGSKGLLPGFRERLGCSDPAAFRLTAEQRRTCADDFGRAAANANPLAHDIPAQKRAEYDHYIFCAKLHKGPIPPAGENHGLGDPSVAGKCTMGTW